MKRILTFSLAAVFALAAAGLFAQNGPSKLLSKGSAPAPTNPANGLCLPCATPEGEPYITEDGIDVTNPGCFETPNKFSPIILGQTYCSNMNTYLYLGTDASTDLDWYKIILTAPKTIYFSVDAPIYGQMYILGPPCSNFVYYNYAYPSSPGVTTVSATLNAGEYYLVYGSYYYLGNGVGTEYMATVTETVPGDPTTWCTTPIPTMTEWGLIILGMALLGFGTFYILRMKSA